MLQILGIRKNDLNLSYVYKVELGNDRLVFALNKCRICSSKNLNPAKS